MYVKLCLESSNLLLNVHSVNLVGAAIAVVAAAASQGPMQTHPLHLQTNVIDVAEINRATIVYLLSTKLMILSIK
jgi:hypothetical protein